MYSSISVYDIVYLFQMLDGGTALSVACQGGHTETAKVLLDKGAIIDYQNEVRMVNVCILWN